MKKFKQKLVEEVVDNLGPLNPHHRQKHIQ